MNTRRNFFKWAGRAVLAVGLMWSPVLGGLSRAWAKAKRRLLPKETSPESLSGHHPAEIDARDLGITPLEKFGTMGLTDFQVDLAQWRLNIKGKIKKPLSLNYQQIRARPILHKRVLLICPGVFSYKAEYKGLSLLKLLEEAGLDPTAQAIEITGPLGDRGKTERFLRQELENDEVFLAYQVNGKPLPLKHGFPLRVVARDRFGDDWVKYVEEIKVV